MRTIINDVDNNISNNITDILYGGWSNLTHDKLHVTCSPNFWHFIRIFLLQQCSCRNVRCTSIQIWKILFYYNIIWSGHKYIDVIQKRIILSFRNNSFFLLKRLISSAQNCFTIQVFHPSTIQFLPNSQHYLYKKREMISK